MSFITGPAYPFDDLQKAFEVQVPNVNAEIAAGEQMPHTHLPHYFGVGEGVIRLIKLAMLASQKRSASVKKILDMPCGHGRVMRSIRAAFPEAAITACDLLTDGVDYCTQAFGAEPIYSKIHPTVDLFPEGGNFDLIFVGSLFTHLKAARWAEFLVLFESLLAPDGILLFTTHGPYVDYRFQNGETYGYSNRHLPTHPLSVRKWGRLGSRILHFLAQTGTSTTNVGSYMAHAYQQNGFAYLDDGSGYGISVCRPSWAMNQVETHTQLKFLYYTERAWDNHQDACAVIKRKFTTTNVAVGHPFLNG